MVLGRNLGSIPKGRSMEEMNKLFYELIQVAIGNRTCLSRTPKIKEWQHLYEIAKKQSLVGICFVGVQKLQAQRQAPNSWGDERGEMLYLQWMGMAAKIQRRNEVVTKQCSELQTKLSADGFKSCVLKGQGVAQLYDDSLRSLRQSGDIDVWVDDDICKILVWIRNIHPLNHCDYMHTHVNLFPGTAVELHYRPWIDRNLVRNRKLQGIAHQYGSGTFVECGDRGFLVPDSVFNCLHILNHIHWHLLVEGVGLRQLLDLYFVLKNSDRKPSMDIIHYLDLVKFTAACMWILKEVFGLEQEHLLCDSDEKEGRFLLDEIMRAGNFGHYDDRIKHPASENKFITVAKWLKHVMRLFWHYPKDVLWTPIGIAYLSIKGRLMK